MKSTQTRDTLSVVVASLVGPPFIDACLRSLERQAGNLGAEVIVTTSVSEDYARRLRERFGWTRVLHSPQRMTVPELRRWGMEQASGSIVAIIEEHCVAAEDWLEQVLAGHARGRYAAVGGPVVDDEYERLRDWVVYFCEYNGYLPPAADSEVTDLNGANIAYRRDVVLDRRELLDSGYWEATLHPALLGAGWTFLSLPKMVVHHRGPFDFGYYLRQRYWFSRAFAAARRKTIPAGYRLAYLLAAPLIPVVLLTRMAGRVWRKKCHVGQFGRSLPLLVPALVVFVAGEWVGYLSGAGSALSRVE